MNNAFRLPAAIAATLLFFCGLKAQTDTSTGFVATPNPLDRFTAFYLHPLSSHYEGNMFEADYGLEFSSNCAINALAYDFYFKKPLNGADIKSTTDKLSALNIGGRETNAGFQFVISPKKMYNHLFTVKYAFRRHQSAEFTNDFGNFFFKGNKEGAGKEQIFDDLQYLTTRYDALQLGWTRFFNIKGRRANIAISAGLARGFEYRRYDVGRSRMLTESNGEYIDLSLELEAKQSYFQPYRPFYLEPSGWGAICDVKFNMAINEKTGIGIDISDIGFIRWKEGSASYSRRDTTIRYEGVFVSSPDSLSSPGYVERLGDSIVTRFNIPFSAGAFNTALPARFALTYYLKFNDKHFLNIRLRAMAIASYRPQLNIESVNFIGKKFYSTTGISIGGFGPFDIYQSCGWQINKRYSTALGLFGIEGMLLPTKTAGFGGRLAVAARL